MNSRVNHMVWIARRENVRRYVDQLGALFDISFELMSDESVDAYISWDSGLELLTPAATDSPGAAAISQELEKRGEGPFAIAVRVFDLSATTERAQSLGFDVMGEITPRDAADRLPVIRSYTSKIDDIRESALGTFLGLKLVACEMSYAHEQQ